MTTPYNNNWVVSFCKSELGSQPRLPENPTSYNTVDRDLCMNKGLLTQENIEKNEKAMAACRLPAAALTTLSDRLGAVTHLLVR